MIPLRDVIPSRTTPYITITIIGLNALAWLFELSLPHDALNEFLTIYGIGRIVPSGTMTALAVAYGYKFGGLTGTVIALAALSLPVFVTPVLDIRLFWMNGRITRDFGDRGVQPSATRLAPIHSTATLDMLMSRLTVGNIDDISRPARSDTP